MVIINDIIWYDSINDWKSHKPNDRLKAKEVKY